jgi:AraC-like DNA-binding protein
MSMSSDVLSAPVVRPRDGRDDRYVRRITGSDIDEATAFFTAGYAIRQPDVTRTGPIFSWEHAAVGDADMSLRTSRFLAGLRGTTRNEDEFIVLWNRAGRTVLTIEEREVELPAGTPIVLPMDRSFQLHHTNVVQSLIHLNRRFVESLAATSDDPDGTRLAFDPFRAQTPEGLASWRAVVRRVSPRFLDLTNPPGPIARREMAEALATAMLSTFPQRSGLRVPEGRIGPEIDRVRRAIDFVHANAHLPIGTTEISAAADLSPRGLQQSFRRHLDTTPGALLRSVRLDAVHRELVAADPQAMTVAEIARAWGFAHLGRFSAAYRSRFGRLPNETLRA